jgi:carbon monoxide dehydrogenase subunit G
VTRILVRRVIERPPDAVWDRLADIADHVTWMADAAAIRFTTERRQGVGAAFECETRVGPLRTLDRMEVTEWSRGETIGVDHRGVVTGTGRFALRGSTDGQRTELTWDEDLRLPWYLGGAVAAVVARPILRRVWTANLRRFAAHVEGRTEG